MMKSNHHTSEGLLAIDLFLNENFEFRHNVLRGMVEYKMKDAADDVDFQPVDDMVLNTIVRLAKKRGLEGNLRTDVKEAIYSLDTPDYDPIRHYLSNLPEHDGVDRVMPFFQRIPGITAQQVYFCSIYLRSMVAHFLQKDTTCGNQAMLLFIGDQGCGKSRFVQSILPPELRLYYLDHLNLANKFDKEMALTHNLLVNIDEFDQVKPTQQAELKQTLTKNRVNGRPIYGHAQADRPRYASFVGTTNNRHPLQDPTGSRRYICMEVPQGKLIDNDSKVDYEQFYAQLVKEVEQGERYYFTNDEVMDIQQLNLQFYGNVNLDDVLNSCFAMPTEKNPGRKYLVSEIISIMSQYHPAITCNRSTSTSVGSILRSLGLKAHHTNKGACYELVCKQVV